MNVNGLMIKIILLCTSKLKQKRKKTLDVLQFTTVYYLFSVSVNSAKLYQNIPIGSSASSLEVLIC